jgi:hypothetical protein
MPLVVWLRKIAFRLVLHSRRAFAFLKEAEARRPLFHRVGMAGRSHTRIIPSPV